MTYCKIGFGPHWAHYHMFLKCAQSLAMYSPLLLTLNQGKSQTAILQLACLVRIFHLHSTISSLLSIKEHALHLTVWIIPPIAINLLAHGNFATHFVLNFLLLSYDFLQGFFTMPTTPSFYFFPRGELGDQIGSLIAPQFHQNL